MQTKPDIQFYHLLETSLEKALPKLLEKAFAGGMRAMIYAHEDAVAALDTGLWAYDAKAFLPHGTCSEENAALQPLLITHVMENMNKASLLIVTNGVHAGGILQASGGALFTRIFDVFDGADDGHVAAARVRWKTYLDAGHGLRYVQQNSHGGWEIKKEVQAKGT